MGILEIGRIRKGYEMRVINTVSGCNHVKSVKR